MSTFIAYRKAHFSDKIKHGRCARQIVAQLAAVTEEYEKKGYAITVRGVYYQLVGRDLTATWEFRDKKTGFMRVQPNCPEAYNLVKMLMGKGRDAGLISWTAVEDRNRRLMGTPFVETPREAIEKARGSYALDLWHNQAFRPQVWVEKEAQAATVGRACSKLRVDYFACKGYASQSAMWELAQRLQVYIHKGQRPIIFHLGDHDPSGIDMTRDNQERLSLYAGTPIQVVRLALNRDQIDAERLPPNPAKMTDSRAEEYVAEHGYSSWELDARTPEAIEKTITDAVLKIRDPAKWSEALAEEAEDKDRLDRIIEELDA